MRRLVPAVLAACTISACSDSTGPVPHQAPGASVVPQMDGGYLGNGGRTASDSTSTTATATAMRTLADGGGE